MAVLDTGLDYDHPDLGNGVAVLDSHTSLPRAWQQARISSVTPIMPILPQQLINPTPIRMPIRMIATVMAPMSPVSLVRIMPLLVDWCSPRRDLRRLPRLWL